MNSNSEIEFHIRHNYAWSRLPANVKQCLGNSQTEYEKAIVTFSIKNQIRYRGNLVSRVHHVEQRYYEELLAYSQAKLLLYPYHLSDMVVRGLRVTPFQYYLNVLESIMEAERSLRLLGIGRNEYIELMNTARSGRKLFGRRRPARSLLPQSPLSIPLEPWWIVQIGCILEEDIKVLVQRKVNY
ncbi:hypothetical protein B566_EDAN015447 [Ephemera danica]|nr:hypothetical protein B566_EDAN015447 [Ephemera danica]